MRRVIIKEFEDLAEALSSYNAMFAFRIKNLCVKAEEVSLLPVKVPVEGEMQNLEACSTIGKSGDYEFVIIPKYDDDILMIGKALMAVHPEFKQKEESKNVEITDKDGNNREVETHYLRVTMPEVDDDRYDLLKDGVKLAYDQCKAQMEAANVKADARLAQITIGEPESNMELIKQERDKLNEQWYGQRDKLYNDKLQEIEDAHNKWLSEKSEIEAKEQEQAAARGEGVGSQMKLTPDDEDLAN